MRVKICGITNLEDALQAIDCGADALGFVFYPPSARYITPQEARVIIDALPPFVECVGLFVNESRESIEEISKLSGVTCVQIHYEVEEAFLESITLKTLAVVRAESPKDLEKFSDRYHLVDAYTEAYGGEGKRLNLEWFEGRDCSKMILAGGLSPENLNELKGFNFYGVDVSSGVESHKGIKDHLKIKQFIAHAKSI